MEEDVGGSRPSARRLGVGGSTVGLNLSGATLRAMDRGKLTVAEGAAFAGGVSGRRRRNL